MKTMPHHMQLSLGPLSLQLHKRSALLTIILALLTLSAVLGVLLLGRYPLSLAQISQLLMDGGAAIDQLVFFEIRLPRILVALFTGGLLGLSGAIFQAMLRNPLASPDILGLNVGASTGALASMIFLGGTTYLIPGALAGAVLTAALIIVLSWNRGIDLFRLIMVGIGVGFTLLACSDFLMTKLDIQRAVEIAKWLVGSFSQANSTDIWLAGLSLLIIGPIVLILQFSLDRMIFDDDIATALGLKVNATRLALVIAGVLLVAISVIVAGPIPFVAFVAGPIARQMARSASSSLFLAMIVGMIVTLLADTIARTIIPAFQLPTGVFTALLGAPYLIWLLAKQAKRNQL